MKNELQEYEKHKCNGAILRSKSKWALESDRNTAYFLAKFRKIQTEF